MSQEERARAALAVLAQVDQELAGVSCEASTDCCRFRVTGREPWLTLAEWELVHAEVRRQGRRLPALNQDADGRCPFLNEAGRCLVYAARPLGCRTHFCERATPSAPRTSGFREAARQLSALSVEGRSGEDDGRSRPITSWLSQASSKTGKSGKSGRRQNWK